MTCTAHSMSPEERKEYMRGLGTRSAAVRTGKAEARRGAQEAARMGLRAMLGARLEERADKLTDKLETLALSDDPAIALRGIELWLSRVYGKAVQPTSDVTPELPADVEALRAMSPEERRALLQSMPPLRP